MSRRRSATARVLQGWENGFSAAPSGVMTAMETGYRGILGARERLYRWGILRSQPLRPVVVSIGNLTVGGTGKTPATELAALTLSGLGRRPAIVSRGYRRQSRGVQVVADTASIRLEPQEAGDEPFLLARRLPGVPVVVGSNRHQAARVAVDRFGVNAIVLDDGFQHRTLRKDLEIVMVRTAAPWGNGRLLPGGPLREPLTALARANLIVATGVDEIHDVRAVRDTAARWAPGVPVLAATYVPAECWRAERMEPVPLEAIAEQRLLAFAGIAAPTAFERTLDNLGARLAEMVSFDDHHWYSRADLAHLAERAAALGAEGLVTTEKDWVRLRMLPLPARPLYVVSIRLDLVSGMGEWQAAFESACRKG